MPGKIDHDRVPRKRYPSKEEIEDVLEYNSCLGILVWKIRPESHFINGTACKKWNTRYSGRPAGSVSGTDGYLYIRINKNRYLSHRLVMILALGDRFDHDLEVDHKNGERLVNKVENLRLVTIGENRKNSQLSSKNTSGHVGVHFCRRSKRWIAKVQVNGRHIHIGAFVEKASAALAAETARQMYGFSDTHGRIPSFVRKRVSCHKRL